MTQYLVDTNIKIATCNRCGTYVFACMVGGFKVMAEPTPLDIVGYRGALLDGRGCYRLLTAAGKPHRLSPVSGTTDLSTAVLVADHACGTRSMNSTRVDVTEVVPPKACVEPAGATATGVRPRSNRPVLCKRCREIIRPDRGELYWGITGIPEGDYFEHTECP